MTKIDDLIEGLKPEREPFVTEIPDSEHDRAIWYLSMFEAESVPAMLAAVFDADDLMLIAKRLTEGVDWSLGEK